MVEIKANNFILRTITEHTELRKRLWYTDFIGCDSKTMVLAKEVFVELSEELPVELINSAIREFKEKESKDKKEALLIPRNQPYIYHNKASLMIDFKNSTVKFATCFGFKEAELITPNYFDPLDNIFYLHTSIMYVKENRVYLDMLFGVGEEEVELEETERKKRIEKQRQDIKDKEDETERKWVDFKGLPTIGEATPIFLKLQLECENERATRSGSNPLTTFIELEDIKS